MFEMTKAIFFLFFNARKILKQLEDDDIEDEIMSQFIMGKIQRLKAINGDIYQGIKFREDGDIVGEIEPILENHGVLNDLERRYGPL